MSQSVLYSDHRIPDFPDIRQGSRYQRLYASLRTFFSRFPALVRQQMRHITLLADHRSPSQTTSSVIERSTNALQELSPSGRRYANLRALLLRFLTLAYKPVHFAHVVIDCWLLLQSTWSGKQLGPDVVYPMLSISKRQSGRLARLILEYSRDDRPHEPQASTSLPQGIDPPSVAVINLGEPPQDVIENKYSTQADRLGLVCTLILFEISVSLILHVFYLWNLDSITVVFNWIPSCLVDLALFWYAASCGDGTLTLAQRSSTSTPGCAVLLDQDFTLVLNGSQSLVEAIAESGFNLSYPNSNWRPPLGGEKYSRDSFIIGALCEGFFFAFLALCCLALRPRSGVVVAVTLAILIVILCLPLVQRRSRSLPRWSTLIEPSLRFLPTAYILLRYEVGPTMIYSIVGLHYGTTFLLVCLLSLFSAGYNARNYPIQSAKFIDALRHPRTRKWQFDTLAAAVTFQCLIICHNTPRPIRSIDVLALLDMLIPDQRDVWKAWKERVADRIMHEDDISFAPIVPTFRDERQQQLKELLDQAQFGDHKYRDSFCQNVRH